MSEPALRLEHVSKQFGATRALSDIDLEVGAGLIHSLLGANGSGKSTLIKVLSGYHTPDDGARIWVRGREMSFPIDPVETGVAIVHQDLGLLEDATVLENIGISSRYGARRWGTISWRAERERVRASLERLGSSLSLDQRVGLIQPADRTIVGIARALRQIEAEGVEDPILLLDEPTVTLPPLEVARLFSVMRDIAANGGSVIFITHRLREAIEISDRISVLRDGELVETQASAGIEIRELVESMHGQDGRSVPHGAVSRSRAARVTPSDARTAFAVEHVSGRFVNDVSFTIAPGEVIGLTGLAGMGQDELPYLITGATPMHAGRVAIDGVVQKKITPARAWRNRVALVPANRAVQSMWPAGSLTENYTIVSLRSYFRGGRLARGRESVDTDKAIERYAVRAPGSGATMTMLSGGNQQKLIIGRALKESPRVLLLHEPFIGIDAAARSAVLDHIESASAARCAVGLFSIEYELLAEMCDRVLVMSHGSVVTELSADSLTEAAIVRAVQEA